MKTRGLRGALVALALLLAWTSPLRAAVADVLRLPPVTVIGAPRSLVTLVVPVPTQLEGSNSIAFDVVQNGSTEILGRVNGTLSGGRSGVMITLRIPSDARVGILDVADVSFRSDDGRTIVVPILLRVPAVRYVRITPPPTVQELRAGDRVELQFRVENLGNAPERLTLEYLAPGGWTLRSDPREEVSLAAYSSTVVRMRLVVPSEDGPGGVAAATASVIQRISADSTQISSAVARLVVRESDGRGRGLMAETFVASAIGNGGNALATGFALSGLVSDSLSMDLRMVPYVSNRSTSGFGLAGVGGIGVPVQFSLNAPRWRGSYGNTASRITDLTGVNVVGVGAQVEYFTPKVEALSFVSQPMGASGQAGQHLGAGVWTNNDFGRVGASVSRLEESVLGTVSRELNSVGVDYQSVRRGPWQFGGGLAYRAAFGDAALGYRLGTEFETGTQRVSLRHTSTPGGSRTFASGLSNAEAVYSGEFAERFGVDASFVQILDRAPQLGALRNRMATAGGRMRVGEASSLSLRASRSTFTTDAPNTTIGDFGSAVDQFALGVGTVIADWGLNGELQSNVLSRESELLGGATARTASLQQRAQLFASRALEDIGVLSLGMTGTITDGALGFSNRGLNSSVGLSGIRVTPLGQQITLSTRINSFVGNGILPRLGATVSALANLPAGLQLQVSAERNAFFTDASGRPLWTGAVRLTARERVFTPRRLTKITGVVFEDTNGNGVRDPGEAGVPNVVLRQDGLRAVSEDDGSYRVPSNIRGKLRVDPRGLPAGFVMSPGYARTLAESRDIPLVRTGTLRIRLQIGADSAGRTPEADLARVELWLRDGAGVEWAGRAMGAGEFLFESIPTGRYSFELDLSRLSEPLRAEEGVIAEVAAGVEREVTLVLRGRAVRIILPPPPSRDGVRGGRSEGRGGQRGSR